MPTQHEIEADTLWAELPMAVQNSAMDASLEAVELTKHRDRESWLKIGKGLHDIREEAKRRAGTDNLKHPDYRRYYKLVLENKKMFPLKELDKHDHAGCHHAEWMYENWEIVEPFLAAQGVTENLRSLNHPSAIRRRFDADTKRKPQGLEKAPTKSKRQEARIDELQEQNRELRAELREALAAGVTIGDGVIVDTRDGVIVETSRDHPILATPTAPGLETSPIRRAVLDQPTPAPALRQSAALRQQQDETVEAESDADADEVNDKFDWLKIEPGVLETLGMSRSEFADFVNEVSGVAIDDVLDQRRVPKREELRDTILLAYCATEIGTRDLDQQDLDFINAILTLYGYRLVVDDVMVDDDDDDDDAVPPHGRPTEQEIITPSGLRYRPNEAGTLLAVIEIMIEFDAPSGSMTVEDIAARLCLSLPTLQLFLTHLAPDTLKKILPSPAQTR